MAQTLVDRRDLDFVIWEQMEGETLLDEKVFPGFNKKTCDMVINEARSLAIKEMLPTLAEGDRQGVRYENGRAKVPECFNRPHRLLLEGEWINLQIGPEMGGQGAPPFLSFAAIEYFMAANWSVYAYAAMGCASAGMIHNYGTPEQIDLYVEKLVSGKWGGTMLLTEPQAGSDVGAIETTAVKQDDGSYLLTGNKIFITNGDHDLCENIVHPVLARVEGHEPGTKGISIFIVPKLLPGEDGAIGKPNDIVCVGVEEKHGIHGSATCAMSMGSKGECVGYLLGEEKQGMKIMFQMMNEARLATGIQALSHASAACLLAVNYARERIQGKDIERMFDAGAPSVPIIRHPDVRRNLLWMKAMVDGMRSFFHYAAIAGLKGFSAESDEKKQEWADLFELLTPFVKEYLAVKSHEVCVQAMQVHGGAGYTRDYLVEQYLRDCKITSIVEGCGGIQALDLVGRKMPMKNGAVFMSLMGKMGKTVEAAQKIDAAKDMAPRLEAAVGKMGEAAMTLGALAMEGKIKTALAHSLPFLHAGGDVIVAWMLLWRACVAAPKIEGAKKKDRAFYQGQVKTAEFFIHTALYETIGKFESILAATSAAVDIPDDGFGGL
ncbi:Acyl-CoA dehydrogenase [Candidatus Desulfarcum epimagneticum]|uniref:3-methylmercaptopropionyl-CoA dehydrogenase n=1 Tax=uncultured Desulfobacteraceae bacterium TaxID=218296 RepID=A0A484HCH8_9BACT|nr:Acyl-CoA dehydrogenase [uncultured Desulfobacteraceae bacterium]